MANDSTRVNGPSESSQIEDADMIGNKFSYQWSPNIDTFVTLINGALVGDNYDTHTDADDSEINVPTNDISDGGVFDGVIRNSQDSILSQSGVAWKASQEEGKKLMKNSMLPMKPLHVCVCFDSLRIPTTTPS